MTNQWTLFTSSGPIESSAAGVSEAVRAGNTGYAVSEETDTGSEKVTRYTRRW